MVSERYFQWHVEMFMLSTNKMKILNQNKLKIMILVILKTLCLHAIVGTPFNYNDSMAVNWMYHKPWSHGVCDGFMLHSGTSVSYIQGFGWRLFSWNIASLSLKMPIASSFLSKIFSSFSKTLTEFNQCIAQYI